MELGLSSDEKPARDYPVDPGRKSNRVSGVRVFR